MRTLVSDIWIPCSLMIIRQIFKIFKNSESANSALKLKIRNLKILIENKKVFTIVNNVYLFFNKGGAGERDFDNYEY